LLELSQFGGYQPDAVVGDSAMGLPRRASTGGPQVVAPARPSGVEPAGRDPGQASALFSAFRSGVKRASNIIDQVKE
jgi:hypothetical protein